MIYHTVTMQLGLLQRGESATRAGFNKNDGTEESISRAAPRKVLPLIINSGPLVIKLSGNKEKVASKESEGDSSREERRDAVVGLPMWRAEPPLPHPVVQSGSLWHHGATVYPFAVWILSQSIHVKKYIN